MFNLMKVAFVQLALSGLVFAGSGPLDDGVDVCGVPVCDIDITIEALTELNENQRYNYANKLVRAYADEKQPEILNNLKESAIPMRDLSKSLEDADWVIRESSTLLNNSIFNLAKYSDINTENLIDLFSQLDNQAKRYEVISYWQGRILKVENISDLSSLVAFSMKAAVISKEAGDEAWVARAAKALASEITVKLTNLDPAHEGVFGVKITSDDTKTISFDKVIILDSTSEKNLVVKFINSKFNKVAFEYSQAKLVGNEISASFISNGSLSSSVKLTYDRFTGAVSGTIQTTKTAQITFEGSQEFSTREIFNTQSAPMTLTENDIVGETRGEILGLKGTLSIRSFSPQSYAVHFVADNGFIVLDFVGKFFAKTGVLSVTHKNKVKLVLALKDVDGELKWAGKSFSTTNGKVNTATFDRL